MPRSAACDAVSGIRSCESPSVHSTDPIANLRFILFGFDGRDSVIIGPVGLNQKQHYGKLSGGTVPNLMEFGRTAGIREKLVGTKWMPRQTLTSSESADSRANRGVCAASVHGTGVVASRQKFPTLWARSVSA